jgi:hypothetical protein
VGSNREERGQQAGSEAGSRWAAIDRKVGQKKGEGAKNFKAQVFVCLFVAAHLKSDWCSGLPEPLLCVSLANVPPMEWSSPCPLYNVVDLLWPML